MRSALIIVLRVFGAIDLLALLAVFMPQEWMAIGHRWVGLGEISLEPLVGYLARSTSAVYALHGALILFISFDIDRYCKLIRFLAVAAVLHGALLLWIDFAEGMPLWWTLLEGPCLIATGAVVLVLQQLAMRKDSAGRWAEFSVSSTPEIVGEGWDGDAVGSRSRSRDS